MELKPEVVHESVAPVRKQTFLAKLGGAKDASQAAQAFTPYATGDDDEEYKK